VSGRRAIDALRTPWPLVTAAVVALTAAAARAPLAAAAAVSSAALIALLVWRFGGREGLWYLFLAAIPFREPLSIDVHGTVSLFFGDVLLLALVVSVAHESGVTGLWRRSLVFKLGLAVLALSLVGLFTASRFFWGVASVYTIVGQLAVFYVASNLVRTPREALRSLTAVVLGLVPAVVYGLYQASLPFGAALPDWATSQTAWGPTGERNLRVFSTFRHTLHYAHYLSLGFGLALGLAGSRLARGLRFLCFTVGVAAAYAAFFAYSIGGILAVVAAAVTVLLVRWRRAAVVLVPVTIALLLILSPDALMRKFDRVLTGEATTGAARLITLGQAAAVLRDHPLTGVGWGGIRSSLEHEYRVTRGTAIAYTAENYFFQRGMALGFPGLALYVVLFVLFFRSALRARGDTPEAPWPRAAVLAGGVAFYLQAQAIPATQATANYVLWLLFALAERMDAAPAGRPAAGGADH
jgi:O-antigen ligase